MEVEATDDVVPMGGVARQPSMPRVQRNLSKSSSNLSRSWAEHVDASEIGDLEAELQAIAVAPSMPFEAIVHIKNNSATLNLISPWKVLGPQTSTGTGFHIGKRRILTNCHVVKDATSLRVSRHGTPGNFDATVLCQSHICDLALVTVAEDEFWDGLPAVRFQDAVPDLDDTVCAVGYPLGATSVTLTRGVVSNVKMSDLSLTDLQECQLNVQIDAAINPGNSGGPVFNQRSGEVVGVAFSGRPDAKGQGFIIPTPVVRNFLATYEATGSFGRLPDLGIRGQILTNNSMRRLLIGGGTRPRHHDGILITCIDQYSAAEAAGVLAGDILMAIDGHAISEEGEVVFRGHERVEYQYLITSKQCGDQVELSLLRSAANTAKSADTTVTKKKKRVVDLTKLAASLAEPTPITLPVKLAPTRELCPRELYKDYFPEFALIGGLVFVIAGLPLLEQCLHSRGMHELIGSLTELIGSKESDLKKSGEEGDDDDDEDDDKEEDGEGGDRAQALLCSSCLAHDVNEGFRDFVGCRLLRINGKRVKNLAHLVELMAPYMAGLVEGQGKEASSTATSKEPAPTTPPNQEDAAAAPSKDWVVLNFYSHEESAVFETQTLRAATPTILQQHKIPSWTSLPPPPG